MTIAKANSKARLARRKRLQERAQTKALTRTCAPKKIYETLWGAKEVKKWDAVPKAPQVRPVEATSVAAGVSLLILRKLTLPS